jgi:cysteine desulfurase/selenocysteine lyase
MKLKSKRNRMLPNKNKVIYMDAAASALKPASVVSAQLDFLDNHYANAGRGVCQRADYADKMVADARESVANFIGAAAAQVIFTSGATDGLNRLSNMLPTGSVVAVSDLDHHSARLPFQEKHKTLLCELDENFNYKSVPECDAFILTAMSNVLGMAQDIEKIIGLARAKYPNIKILVDASQWAIHEITDVKKWDVDALVFSGHKLGADTGLGALYLKQPDNWQTDKFGGGQFKAIGPAAFEAGTLPLTQLAGLPSAISHQSSLVIREHTKNMTDYLYSQLGKIERIKFVSPKGAALLSFTIDEMHAYDFGALMGAYGVCLRVGNMCASWLHQRLGLDATIRISVGAWNTMAECEQVVKIINEIVKK